MANGKGDRMGHLKIPRIFKLDLVKPLGDAGLVLARRPAVIVDARKQLSFLGSIPVLGSNPAICWLISPIFQSQLFVA